MENNVFKNIKNKLASCFMKKEEKLLLKMAKYKNFGENVASSSLALLIGFIASLFGFAIIFDVFTLMTPRPTRLMYAYGEGSRHRLTFFRSTAPKAGINV